MALRPDPGHPAGMRETEILTVLKPPEQEPGFDPSLPRERRCLDFAVEPDERLFPGSHERVYVTYDIMASLP